MVNEYEIIIKLEDVIEALVNMVVEKNKEIKTLQEEIERLSVLIPE